MDDTEQESFVIGEPSPDGRWWTLFEDNGETGYMYLCVANPDGSNGEVIDHLWVYNRIAPPIDECQVVEVLWTKDSSRAFLHVDQECWGLFDLPAQRKMNAPRGDGQILPIDWEKVRDGLTESDGEPLRLVLPPGQPKQEAPEPDWP